MQRVIIHTDGSCLGNPGPGARDNIFTAMVAHLWQTDTPTNLWPSIHVYNSIGAHVALCRCSLGDRKSTRLNSSHWS